MSQMLLSPFRSNQFSASLLLIFYVAALQVPAIWSERLGLLINDSGASVFGQWLGNWTSWPTYIQYLTTVAILFATAVAVNRLCEKDKLGANNTQLPGLFYSLMASYVAAFFPPSSMHLANLLLLISLFPFLNLYKHQKPVVPLFWSGWWLGLAFLVNTYYLIFLAAAIFALPILQKTNFRRVLQLISGWIAPIFFLFCRDYLFDADRDFIASLWNGVGLPTMGFSEGYWTSAGLIVLGICLVWVFISRSSLVSRLQTDGRYKIQVLYAILIFAVLSHLLQDTVSAASVQIVVLPLGMLLGLALSGVERSRAESTHYLLIGVFLGIQLIPFYLR
ncbi:MAG: hypothetical protein AAF741_18555 [Bacteroidota bacterium]